MDLLISTPNASVLYLQKNADKLRKPALALSILCSWLLLLLLCLLPLHPPKLGEKQAKEENLYYFFNLTRLDDKHFPFTKVLISLFDCGECNLNNEKRKCQNDKRPAVRVAPGKVKKH